MRNSFLLFLLLSGCGSSPTDQQMWSRSWGEPTGDVMRALAAKGIQGCGEFYEKENATSHADYAVACSEMPDGSGHAAWVGYEVFPEIGEVLGPDLTAVYTKFGGPPGALTNDDANGGHRKWRHTKKSRRE